MIRESAPPKHPGRIAVQPECVCPIPPRHLPKSYENSMDAIHHNTHEIVYVQVPMPTALAALYAASGVPTALPIPAELFRAALNQHDDPRDRFSELDTLIAAVVDEHGPVQAKQVAELLDTDHDHITTDAGVRNRLMRGRPLNDAGYHSTPQGYVKPQKFNDV